MATIRLSDIAEIVMGQSPTGETCNLTGEGLPLLNGPTEFGSYHPLPQQYTTDARKRAAKGDLLFCVRGSTTGKMNWADREYAIGRGLAAIRHKKGEKYQPLLRALIEFNLPMLLQAATGSTFPNVSLSQLQEIKLKEISAEDAERFSYIFGLLDTKIDINRRMSETLEATARAIFRSWFVDFDPVRAKVEGRQPFGMDSKTASLFPDSFDESEMGQIPRGWEARAIGDLVDTVGGATPSTKESAYWDGDVCFATPKDMSSLSSPVLLGTERHITEAGVAQISSGILPIGTVLLSSRAPIGYLAITEVPVAVNQGVIAMICNHGLPNYFVLNWIAQNMETIIGRANGTTFLEISKKNFRPIKVVVPTAGLLQRFVEIVEPLYKQITLNLNESQTLRTLRDTLLPKLMSGELLTNSLTTL